MAEYHTFDQKEKLGPPPWRLSPALIAWEQAHGHDPRVKCHSELGCVLVESELREEIDRLRGLLADEERMRRRQREEAERRVERLRVAATPVATLGLHINTQDPQWIRWVIDLRDALGGESGNG